jgi:hypothetical protein
MYKTMKLINEEGGRLQYHTYIRQKAMTNIMGKYDLTIAIDSQWTVCIQFMSLQEIWSAVA